MRRVILLGWLLLVAAVAPAAADRGQGLAAFQRGDYVAAMAAWRPLAEAGDAAAQFYLGGLHQQGLGVRKDVREASRWYRRAAEQDHLEAAKRLALVNFAGGHLWTSKPQAVTWFRRAAELGDAESQGFLGLVYREGWAVTPDPVEAMMWLTIAANQGHARAAKDRRGLARAMTTAARVEAEARARAWRPRGG